jgi:hypothetical protein
VYPITHVPLASKLIANNDSVAQCPAILALSTTKASNLRVLKKWLSLIRKFRCTKMTSQSLIFKENCRRISASSTGFKKKRKNCCLLIILTHRVGSHSMLMASQRSAWTLVHSILGLIHHQSTWTWNEPRPRWAVRKWIETAGTKMGLGILRRRRANQANLISTMILTKRLVTLGMIITQT